MVFVDVSIELQNRKKFLPQQISILLKWMPKRGCATKFCSLSSSLKYAEISFPVSPSILHKLYLWNFSAATFFVFWLKNPRKKTSLTESTPVWISQFLFGQNYSPGNTIRLRYERNLIVFPTQFDYVSNAIQLRYNIIQLCMDSIALSNII